MLRLPQTKSRARHVKPAPTNSSQEMRLMVCPVTSFAFRCGKYWRIQETLSCRVRSVFSLKDFGLCDHVAASVGPLLCSEQHRRMGQHHWQVGEGGRNPEWPKPKWPVRKDRQRDPLQRGKTHPLHYHSRWASTDLAEPCLPNGLINIHRMLHKKYVTYIFALLAKNG